MNESDPRVVILKKTVRLYQAFLLTLAVLVGVAFIMGAALTSSDTSGPYSNGDQRITDLTTAAAGQDLTVPDRTQSAVIQAIGGVVYFAHDGDFATTATSPRPPIFRLPPAPFSPTTAT